jgi:Flp pilus assembly protein TadG
LGHSEKGVVAVETAVVSMLLVILLFGIVDSAFLFKDWLSVSAAARAGARMGSSEPRMTNFADDAADQVTNAITGLVPANILAVWVYKVDTTTGLPDSGSFANCTTCRKYIWDTTLKKLIYSSGTWTASSQNACAGDASRQILGVYVKYRHTSPLGFFFNNATLAESTVMWLEPSFAVVCK